MSESNLPAGAANLAKDHWQEVRRASAAGDLSAVVELLREAGSRDSAFELEAAATLALSEAILSFDTATADIEESHARALAQRSQLRESLAAALAAVIGHGASIPAPAPVLMATIPFRLGIVEERLPLTLRPERREVRVRLLGGFEIEVDGAAVGSWRNQKARLVMAYLFAHRGEAVSRQLLMGTFWPEHSEERAANNLSLAIMAARRQIDGAGATTGDSLLRSTAGAYSFDPGAGVWVDTDAFREAAAAGRRLDAEGDSYEAALLLDEAIACYGGDFLPADLYQDWTIEARQGFRDAYIDVLFRRARIARTHSDNELAVQLTRRVLDSDPCSEDAHRQLMLDYARLGQRGRALRQMELCREALDRHLGVEPEPETIAVYERIRGRALGVGL